MSTQNDDHSIYDTTVLSAIALDADERCVLATIRACYIPGLDNRGLHLTGSLRADEEMTDYLQHILLPMADRILSLIGAPTFPLGLSIEALNPTGDTSNAVQIRPSMAGAGILLAILAANLAIPMPRTVAYVGQVMAEEGTMAAIPGLPPGLLATLVGKGIRKLVCPRLQDRREHARLDHPEGAETEIDRMPSPDRLELVQVMDVAGLLKAALPESAVLNGSLSTGVFGLSASTGDEPPALYAAAQFLSCDLPKRFWRTLRRLLMDQAWTGAQELLAARVEYHCRHGVYPAAFGRQLTRILRRVSSYPGLPSGQPLIIPADVLRLSRLADVADYLDVQLLMAAASGKAPGRLPKRSRPHSRTTIQVNPALRDLVGSVLEEISQEGVNCASSRAVDEAAAGYQIDNCMVNTYEGFVASVTSFYTHLTGSGCPRASRDARDPEEQEALSLVRRAFARDGEISGAWAEACNAYGGGLRYIFNRMTEQLKREQAAKHRMRVLKEAMDPLDFRSKRALGQALLEHVAPLLPSELRKLPPEQVGLHWEDICQAYVQERDRMTSFLKQW